VGGPPGEAARLSRPPRRPWLSGAGLAHSGSGRPPSGGRSRPCAGYQPDWATRSQAEADATGERVWNSVSRQMYAPETSRVLGCLFDGVSRGTQVGLDLGGRRPSDIASIMSPLPNSTATTPSTSNGRSPRSTRHTRQNAAARVRTRLARARRKHAASTRLRARRRPHRVLGARRDRDKTYTLFGWPQKLDTSPNRSHAPRRHGHVQRVSALLRWRMVAPGAESGRMMAR
jgi:hypothetical protein